MPLFRGGPGTRVGEGVASGPFGAGSVMTGKRGNADGVKRESAGRSSSSKTASARSKRGGSKGAGGNVDMSGVKTEYHNPLFISSDEDDDDEGPRMDIERINLVSGDEDEVGGQERAQGQSSRGLRPIRLDRREHKERAVAVKVETGSKAPAKRKATDPRDEESLFVPDDEPVTGQRGKDVEFLRDERRFRGVYQDDADVQVKEEPGEQREVFAVDAADGTSSRLDQPTVEGERVDDGETRQSRQRNVVKDTQPVLQTEEDRQEWKRHERDVKLLSDELGHMLSGRAPSTVVDGEGDTSMVRDGQARSKHVLTDQEDASRPADYKYGRLYLFQFPPILPSLYKPIKDEAKAETAEVEVGAIPNPTASTRSAPAPPEKPSKQQQTPNPQAITAKDAPLPSGRVGKLRVHASGRVMLSWGGASLQLSRGMDTGFLQDVVLADVGGDEKGDARGLGKGLSGLSGKFVVAPAWEELLQ
ncbi:MAG: hypothetical protein M1832_001235 [Thelocarpon impressellum]|nr:MAG: hypothetical protein M1832_001235 [Thelocarpon impressellum]